MFTFETIHLNGGEEMIKVFRSHPLRFFRPASPFLLFFLLLFFFFFPLFSLGVLGGWIFFILVFFDVLIIITLFFRWYGTLFILTNTRLLAIERRGVFRKIVHEIVLKNVSELSYQTKGIIHAVCRSGTISLSLTTTRGFFALPDIASPHDCLDLLSKHVRAAQEVSSVV